jgi:ATP-binding cassette subfamily F protein 3
VLRASEIQKNFGARVLFDGATLEVRAEDRIGLVGRNGEGKTTLLRILAGIESPDDGEITLSRGARIGYLRQEIDPQSGRTVIEEASTALDELQRIERELREIEAQVSRCKDEVPAALAQRYDALERSFTLLGGFESDARLRATLSGLGLGEDTWDEPITSLSGGWLMRVELAKLLLRQPEVLLLDEPTNHLDLPSIAWFESTLAQYPGGVVVVSHDRAFLDRHVNRIAALEHGRLTTYAGNYAAYEQQKALREAEREAQTKALDRRIQHASTLVERFGAKASKASQAQSRKKQIEKLEAERAALAPPQRKRTLRFDFPEGVRSGETVLRMEGVDFAYGPQRVYQGLGFELRRAERVALVGPNGAGKSTLLKLAAGSLAAQTGTIELGHNVRLGYFAQHQLDALDPARTVYQEVEASAPLDWVPRLRGLLGNFLFSGDDVEKKVAVLSGGERARLALAKLFLYRANLLILDEPTNHLDIQARDILCEALGRFPGTLLFISHDRRFIDALATRVVAVLPGRNGAEATSHSGNYSDYMRRVGAPTAQPTLAPRGATAVASAAGAAGAGAPTQPGRSSAAQRPAGKLSSNARRKLEQDSRDIEEAIAELEQQLEQLDTLFADPAVARDGNRVRDLRRGRELLELELRERYEAWEEISNTLAAADSSPQS